MRFAFVSLAVLLLAGCGGQAKVTVRASTAHLTAADNGAKLTLEPHEAVVLTLPSDRSSGYRWEGAPASQAGLGFRLLSHRYTSETETWRFRPVGRGGADLGFFYGRLLRQPRPEHWSVARRFDVSVAVR